MTKKVKHAEKPAAAEPETVLEDSAAVVAEQEAPALVEGDGGGPAAGAEHQEGEGGSAAVAAGAAGLVDADVPFGATESAGATVASGMGQGAAGDQAGAEQPGSGGGGDAAAATDEPEEGGEGTTADDGDGAERRELGQTLGWPDTVLAGAKFVEVLPVEGMAIGDQVITYDNGVYSCMQWDGEPPAWICIAKLGTPHPRELSPFEAYANAHPGFHVASNIAGHAFDHAFRIAFPEAGSGNIWEYLQEHPEIEIPTGEGLVEAAKLLRQIGHARATVDVVATQLQLKRLVKTTVIGGPMRVALEVFLFALASFDGFEKADADRRAHEEAERNRQPAPATPIDETTMELVDGPMATWGGR